MKKYWVAQNFGMLSNSLAIEYFLTKICFILKEELSILALFSFNLFPIALCLSENPPLRTPYYSDSWPVASLYTPSITNIRQNPSMIHGLPMNSVVSIKTSETPTSFILLLPVLIMWKDSPISHFRKYGTSYQTLNFPETQLLLKSH